MDVRKFEMIVEFGEKLEKRVMWFINRFRLKHLIVSCLPHIFSAQGLHIIYRSWLQQESLM
jgi:hypothetical protein